MSLVRVVGYGGSAWWGGCCGRKRWAVVVFARHEVGGSRLTMADVGQRWRAYPSFLLPCGCLRLAADITHRDGCLAG